MVSRRFFRFGVEQLVERKKHDLRKIDILHGLDLFETLSEIFLRRGETVTNDKKDWFDERRVGLKDPCVRDCVLKQNIGFASARPTLDQ